MPPLLYLDYNATTPVDGGVLDRMLPYFGERFGNPSSEGHPAGWMAAEAVDRAREQVGALLHAPPRALTFTSGATEACNLAIKGVAHAYARKGRHLVTVETEHKAVLDTCRALERDGFRVTYLPVDADGLVDPGALRDALTDETTLAAVMWANNETGVLQPVPDFYEAARTADVLFMTDATQAAAKVPVDVAHADLLVCSGHKMYGPKGVGVLYASRRRPRVRLVPLVDGGGQEEGRRGGTVNVPAVVGMGEAAALAAARLDEDAACLERLRDRLEGHLTGALDDVAVNGAGAPRLPQTSSLTFRGVRAEKLEMELRGLAVATGSACSTGADRPSHVLTAMGLTEAEARATLRFSLGRPTTEDDVDRAAEQVVDAVRSLRATAAIH